jgi:hypothetical protein
LGEVGVTSSLHKRKLLKVIGDWVARNETIFTSVASMSVSPEVRRLFLIIHQHSSMCDAVPSAGVCGAVSCTSPACALHARAQRGRGARGSSCFICYTYSCSCFCPFCSVGERGARSGRGEEAGREPAGERRLEGAGEGRGRH